MGIPLVIEVIPSLTMKKVAELKVNLKSQGSNIPSVHSVFPLFRLIVQVIAPGADNEDGPGCRSRL